MIGLLCFVLAVLTSPFKSRLRLEAENAALRHQLMVLRRRLQGRIRLTNHDRWFLIQLYRWFPCQSAPKIDPVSASNFDPFERRGLAVALGSSELAGVAETRRARVA